ncbi:hypothetical protein C8R44DRAFT_896017 [Mycena epipterygia]|nr:hypothetical protein C8R44DRAFT_896017 [Mycena epipterygia]
MTSDDGYDPFEDQGDEGDHLNYLDLEPLRVELESQYGPRYSLQPPIYRDKIDMEMDDGTGQQYERDNFEADRYGDSAQNKDEDQDDNSFDESDIDHGDDIAPKNLGSVGYSRWPVQHLADWTSPDTSVTVNDREVNHTVISRPRTQIVKCEVIREVFITKAPDEAGMDDETTPLWGNSTAVLTRRMTDLKISHDRGFNWLQQSVFKPNPDLGAGMWVISIGESKPGIILQRTTLLIIISGAVEMNLQSIDKEELPAAEGRLILTSGGMLMVPAFNSIQLTNIGNRDIEVYVFYAPEEQRSQRAQELLNA